MLWSSMNSGGRPVAAVAWTAAKSGVSVVLNRTSRPTASITALINPNRHCIEIGGRRSTRAASGPAVASTGRALQVHARDPFKRQRRQHQDHAA